MMMNDDESRKNAFCEIVNREGVCFTKKVPKRVLS